MKNLNTLVTTTFLNKEYWMKALKKHDHIEYSVIENTAGKLFEQFDETKRKKDDDTLVLSFAGRYSGQKNWPLAIDITEKMYNILGKKLKVIMAVGCLDNSSLKKTETMFEKLDSKMGNNFNGFINIDIEKMDEI